MSKDRINPAPDQESVWDYPRPPKVEDSDKHILVEFNDTVIADTISTKRVLETSQPPVYYIPPEDVELKYLVHSVHVTFCEWKGQARYYDITVDDQKAGRAAWFYPDPVERYGEIKNYIAFYPHKMDACFVNGERVRGQEGDFYGGWITDDIVGPFKGGPGTFDW